jgi:tetratricopeptide (TPR) repeat protein
VTVSQAFDRIVPDAENPWPGLHEFGESGKEFFNGRDQETAELFRLVNDAPLTVLFGASGLGKTSLLLAGLSPRLRQQNKLPIYVRLDPQSRGAPLLEQAAAAFRVELDARVLDPTPFPSDELLWEYLHRADLEFWSETNHLLTPVFIFDQFEEVFTLGRENVQAVAKLRADLADLIENRVPVPVARQMENAASPARLDLPARRYKVVLAFREDFLPQVEGWRGEIPSLMRNHFRLLPMNGQQALEAVSKTGGRLVDAAAAQKIVAFAAAADTGLGAKVSGAGSSGAAGASGPDDFAALTVEPALLSLVCTALNEQRKEEKKTTIDEALLMSAGQGIVTGFYERCVSDLPDRGRRFIEEELITESGFRNPFPREDAIAQGYLTEDQLEVLVKRRLLRVERQLGADRIELIHDMLTKAVRLFRDQERARRQAAERDETVRRLATERDESRRVANRRLYLLASAAAALILAVILGGVSYLEWRNASAALEAYKTEQKRRQAEEERRQEAEAANKQLAYDKERTQALQTADKQRAEALIAASSRKAYDTAIADLTNSLSIYERWGDWSGIVHAKVERGKIYALSDRLASAQKDVDDAVETANQNGSAGDKALALESEASLHEQSGAKDTESLYQQAEDNYRLAGDSPSVARIWEWKATRAEKDKRFDAAVDGYRHALERYRIAGDTIGVERIDEAVRRTVPWGFLVDLEHARSFPMRGDRVHVGRDSPEGAQNDISFASRVVSRRHLVVSRTSEGIQVDDERSLNGTTVNAVQLPYGQDLKLSDGDVISLANTEVLRFAVQEQPAPAPPPSAWAIFIDGSTRTYSYLTEKAYSVVLTSAELRIQAGENASAVLRLRDQQKPELLNANGEWSVVFEYKKNDYEYGWNLAQHGKWTPIDSLPARLVKLSADGRQILQEGPSFQIVTIASD